MHFEVNQAYHIYNRGNNKQPIFFSEANYIFFLKKVRAQLHPCCEILSWCLMPNHFHFMIFTNTLSCFERSSFRGKPMQELSYRIGILLSSYSQAINKERKTTGSLFQQKTKSKKLSVEEFVTFKNRNHHYLISCMHYIHQNPWVAGLVNKLEDWEFSSFKDYAGLRDGTFCNKKLLIQLADNNLARFYNDSYDAILPTI